MKSARDFDSQEEFESYVDYMMGNPAEDWENALVKVYWCGKSEGHWDIEGVCYAHRTGEWVWWPEKYLDNMPEGKEHAIEISRGRSL